MYQSYAKCTFVSKDLIIFDITVRTYDSESRHSIIIYEANLIFGKNKFDAIYEDSIHISSPYSSLPNVESEIKKAHKKCMLSATEIFNILETE